MFTYKQSSILHAELCYVLREYTYPNISVDRTFLEAQKDEEKKKRNVAISSDSERNRALLEIERKKAKTVEKEMALIGLEADLLALKAQKQNKMDLLVQSNLKIKTCC